MKRRSNPLSGKTVRSLMKSPADPRGSYTGISAGEPERDVDDD